jgi:hypothetical protein
MKFTGIHVSSFPQSHNTAVNLGTDVFILSERTLGSLVPPPPQTDEADDRDEAEEADEVGEAQGVGEDRDKVLVYQAPAEGTFLLQRCWFKVI